MCPIRRRFRVVSVEEEAPSQRPQMSLYNPAAGLLDTHVTWEDVEKRLRKALNTDASFGPNKSATQIGMGEGFIAKIALVECDWEGAKVSEELPEKVVIKMATCLTLIALVEADPTFKEQEAAGAVTEEMWKAFEDFIKEAHNLEVSAFEFLRTLTSTKAIRIPNTYYTVPFSGENLAGHIVEEYVDNATICPIYTNMTLEQVKEIAAEIGKLQALAFRSGFKSSVLVLAKKDIYSNYWTNFKLDMFEQTLQFLGEENPGFVETGKRILEITPTYMGSNLAVTAHKQLGIKGVFACGDMWSANVMFDKGTQKLRAILDLQLAHEGSACEDLFRLAFAALSTTDRRANMDELLCILHDSMAENMGDEKAPYTLEQLMDTAQLLMPHFAFFLVPLLAPLYRAMVGIPGLSDEESASRKEVMLDKMCGICEDAVVYHDRNEGDTRSFEWSVDDVENVKSIV